MIENGYRTDTKAQKKKEHKFTIISHVRVLGYIIHNIKCITNKVENINAQS